MTLAAERADLPAPGCSAIRRPARKKAGKTHASPPSEAFSNSRRDIPCPVPHASREKHHFRLGYEKSGLKPAVHSSLEITDQTPDHANALNTAASTPPPPTTHTPPAPSPSGRTPCSNAHSRQAAPGAAVFQNVKNTVPHPSMTPSDIVADFRNRSRILSNGTSVSCMPISCRVNQIKNHTTT